jgi:hypothetical protein
MMETVQNLSSGNAPYARTRRFPQPYTEGEIANAWKWLEDRVSRADTDLSKTKPFAD